MFSESNKIATKNSSNGISVHFIPEQSLNNYIAPKIVRGSSIKVKSKILHSICSHCPQVLENKSQQLIGICPSCDNM
jgi:Zn finger protein HypA/HybF involved in hydrogenase expression